MIDAYKETVSFTRKNNRRAKVHIVMPWNSYQTLCWLRFKESENNSFSRSKYSPETKITCKGCLAHREPELGDFMDFQDEWWE